MEKLGRSKEKLSKLQDQLSAAGYHDKVDSEVKEMDAEKLKNFTSEVEALTSFLTSLEKLTI